MSLRDFHAIDDRPFSLQPQPVGNESGLGAFHTVQPEDVSLSNTPKVVGALAVALMIGVAGVGLYASNAGSSSKPKPVVTASNVPAPPPAAPVAMSSATPEATAPVAAADPVAAPATTKTAFAKPARTSVAASTGKASARVTAEPNQVASAPTEQAAVMPVPAAPSPSDVASSSTQSSVAVPSDATTASDIPAPQNTPAPQVQPDQEQPQPAPAQ
jgi:hypothetical protein